MTSTFLSVSAICGFKERKDALYTKTCLKAASRFKLCENGIGSFCPEHDPGGTFSISDLPRYLAIIEVMYA